MQITFEYRFRPTGDRAAANRMVSVPEGPGYSILRAVRSTALVAVLVLYAINPPWLGETGAPFPDWLRWLGVCLGTASLAFYAWSRETLGKAWSSRLQIREKQQLVTAGPYARIRHPVYLALLCFLTSITLITANWLFVAFFAFSIVDLAVRIPKEEQMMIEQFGEAYKTYMQRTGRLLPK